MLCPSMGGSTVLYHVNYIRFLLLSPNFLCNNNNNIPFSKHTKTFNCCYFSTLFMQLLIFYVCNTYFHCSFPFSLCIMYLCIFYVPTQCPICVHLRSVLFVCTYRGLNALTFITTNYVAVAAGNIIYFNKCISLWNICNSFYRHAVHFLIILQSSSFSMLNSHFLRILQTFLVFYA